MGNAQDVLQAKKVSEQEDCNRDGVISSKDCAEDGRRAESSRCWQGSASRPGSTRARSLVDVLREKEQEERESRLQDSSVTEPLPSWHAAPVRLYTPPPSPPPRQDSGDHGVTDLGLVAHTPRQAQQGRWSSSRPRFPSRTRQPAPALKPLPAPSPELQPIPVVLPVTIRQDIAQRAVSQPPPEAAPLELETCMSAGPPAEVVCHSGREADVCNKSGSKADGTGEKTGLRRAFSTSSVDSTVRAAVRVSSTMCPGNTQEKRRAIVALRTTKQALSEMAPFGLPIGKKASVKARQGRGRSLDRIRVPPKDPPRSVATAEDDVPAELKVTRPLSLPAGPCSRWPKEARSTKALAIPSVEV